MPHSPCETADEPLAKRRRPIGDAYQEKYQEILHRGKELWATPEDTKTQLERNLPNPCCGDNIGEHIKGKAQYSDDSDKEEILPYAGKTAPKARLYPCQEAGSLDAWLEEKMRLPKPPNKNQLNFYEHL